MLRPFVILVAAVGLAAPASAREYTLPQLLAKVRADYPGVLKAERDVDSARAVEAQAARAWAPTGSLDFSIFTSGESRCSTPDGRYDEHNQRLRERNCYGTNLQRTISTGDGIIGLLPLRGVWVGLSVYVSQPLYSFGKIESNVALGQLGVESAKETLRAVSEDAALNAIRAYWGLKATRAARATLLDIIKELTKWVKRLTDEMEGVNQGSYTEADLARLKTAFDQVVLVRLDVERNLAYALEAVRLLADDPQADIDQEELSLVDIVPRPLEYFEEAARLHRPEARLLAVGLRSAATVKRLRRAELTPDLSLVSRLDINYISTYDSAHNAFMGRPNRINGTWTLQLRLPLDIPARLQRLTLARADEETQLARSKDALGTIAIDVARAYSDHEEARQREERLGHGEKVARGWYSVTDTNQGQGLAQVTDARELVDAARMYFEFRLRRLQAINDANVTWSVLLRATGAQ